MSRITVFSRQILCRESRSFWSHILTLQKAAGATLATFSNSVPYPFSMPGNLLNRQWNDPPVLSP